MLPGIEGDERFQSGRFLRIGDTDSEQAFCALLERLAPLWRTGLPSLEDRLTAVAAFAAELRARGPANLVHSDGDAIFAHGDRRRGDDGAKFFFCRCGGKGCTFFGDVVGGPVYENGSCCHDAVGDCVPNP